MTNSLSYHMPIVLHFPLSPKPRTTFQYCDMWSSHKDFASIIASTLHITGKSPFQTLCQYLTSLQPLLRRLHRDYFSDLKEKQVQARLSLKKAQQTFQQHLSNTHCKHQEKEARERYISILSSSLALIKQQCKLE